MTDDIDWPQLARYLAGECPPAEARAFEQWIGADPARAALVEHLRRAWDTSATVGPAFDVDRALQIAWLRRSAAQRRSIEAEPNRVLVFPDVVAADVDSPSRRRFGARSMMMATAAAVILAFASGVAVRSARQTDVPFGPNQVVTGPSETTTVTFADGSVVRLAPGSRIRTPHGRNREVTLEGQAFFAVAKLPGVPFRVRTAAGDAVVLGTRFEIRADAHASQVVVLEGRVALGEGAERVEVGGGEISRIVDGATTRPTKVADPYRLVNWLGRFLVFQDTRLSDVIRDVERQYGTRVVLRDSSVASQTITGWYAEKSFDEVMQVICGALGRSCVIEANRATIGGPAATTH